MAKLEDIEQEYILNTKRAKEELKSYKKLLGEMDKAASFVTNTMKTAAATFVAVGASAAGVSIVYKKLIERQEELASVQNLFASRNAAAELQKIEEMAMKTGIGLDYARQAAADLARQAWHPQKIESFLRIAQASAVDLELAGKAAQENVAKVVSELTKLDGADVGQSQWDSLSNVLSPEQFSLLNAEAIKSAGGLKKFEAQLANSAVSGNELIKIIAKSKDSMNYAKASNSAVRQFQRLSDTVSKFTDNLINRLFGSSEEAASLIGKIIDLFKSFEKKLEDPRIQKLIEDFNKAFKKFGDDGVEYLKKKIDELPDTIEDLIETWNKAETVMNVLKPVIFALAGAYTVLAATTWAANAAAAVFAMTPVGRILLAIGAAIGLVIAYWDDLKASFKDKDSVFGGVLRELWAWVKSIAMFFIDIGQAIGNLSMGNFSKAYDNIKSMADNFLHVMSLGMYDTDQSKATKQNAIAAAKNTTPTLISDQQRKNIEAANSSPAISGFPSSEEGSAAAKSPEKIMSDVSDKIAMSVADASRKTSRPAIENLNITFSGGATQSIETDEIQQMVETAVIDALDRAAWSAQ